MLFNSLSYGLFLLIVFILYWCLPHRYRWGVLLVSSYYFYMSWNPKYVVLILGTTVISYVTALLIEATDRVRLKKTYLAIASVVSLGVLFLFKYYNFMMDSVAAVLSAFAIQLQPTTLKLLLPVGISFYTFQTLSYVIDVYRGRVKAEKHFGYYATFISFFPQLVAGPIERTSNLLPQIRSEKQFDYPKAVYGLRLMLIGFLKKVIVADIMAIYVNKIYDDLESYTGSALVIAIVFFTFQIYCDFSGYSDIAIGSAKLLGIDLMKNFNSPYFAGSIKDFWARWHISLSTWFRDYVYIPLGGNRCGKLRHNMNLLITFLVSGLWHGANWTFVVWGGIHGLAQIFENIVGLRKTSKGAANVIRTILTFIFCNIAWVFFRASTFGQAAYVLGHALDGITSPVGYLLSGFTALDFAFIDLLGIVAGFIIMVVFDAVSLKQDAILAIDRWPRALRWAVYIIVIFVIMMFVPIANTSQFIYFQF